MFLHPTLPGSGSGNYSWSWSDGTPFAFWPQSTQGPPLSYLPAPSINYAYISSFLLPNGERSNSGWGVAGQFPEAPEQNYWCSYMCKTPGPGTQVQVQGQRQGGAAGHLHQRPLRIDQRGLEVEA